MENVSTQKTSPISKRLAAYAAVAGVTAATGGTASAAEVVWDIPDVVVSGNGVNFNLLTGAVTPVPTYLYAPASAPGADGVMRIGGFTSYGEIAAPQHATGVGFAGSAVPAGWQVGRLELGDVVSDALSFGVNSAPSYGAFAYLRYGGASPLDTRGIIGIEFTIGTDTHYGWAEVTALEDGTTTLHSFGYNDEVEVASTSVPEPSSMGLLAMGALGLAGWRGRKRSA